MTAVLTFTGPPPGLAPLTDFILDDVNGAAGLYALHAASDPGIRLYVLDAAVYLPWYTPEITDEQALGLGIGAATVVFTVLNAVILRPLPYPDADEIISVSASDKGEDMEVLTDRTLQRWRETSRTTTAIAVLRPASAVIAAPGGVAEVRGEAVTPSFFDVFKVAPLHGRVARVTALSGRKAKQAAFAAQSGAFARILGSMAAGAAQHADVLASAQVGKGASS